VSTRLVARGAVYAALYVVLTVSPGLNAISYGPLQFRVSEGLLVFACVDPVAVVGLTVGTALANVASPTWVIDVWYGTLLTLATVLLMRRLGLRVIALLVPVVINGLGVPVEWLVLQGSDYGYPVNAALVSAGEAAVMFSVGLGLMLLIRADVFEPVLGGRRDRRGGHDGADLRGGTAT